MKRIIILMTVILMFASSVFAECVDSDDGKNYGVKGTTTYTKESYQDVHVDFCTDDATLLEYFCEESTGKPSSEYYHCDCVDGACADLMEGEEEVEEVPEEVPEEESVDIPPEETETEEPEVTPVTKMDNSWIWISAVIIAIIIVTVFWKKKKGKEKLIEVEPKAKKKTKKKK